MGGRRRGGPPLGDRAPRRESTGALELWSFRASRASRPRVAGHRVPGYAVRFGAAHPSRAVEKVEIMTHTHTHTHTQALAACLAVTIGSLSLVAQQEHGIPGSAPGTERWIIELQDRGYALQTELQAIGASPTLAGRQAALATLRQLAATDQAAISQRVANAGGTVEHHYWILSALSVQLPHAAVQGLRSAPRVAHLVPVKARRANDAEAVRRRATGAARVSRRSTDETVALGGEMRPLGPPPPIDVSTNEFNHNVDAAWTILGGGGAQYRGAGARVAVFDTGIDEDVDGVPGTVLPHPAFIDNAGATRIDGIVRAQDIGTGNHADINICTIAGGVPYVGATGPFGFRPGRHNQAAAHGTAMASIIAGRAYTVGPVGNPVTSSRIGHVPDARLIDVACSSYEGLDARSRWIFTDDGYLGGIERLREYILANRPAGQTSAYVHVANLSIGGEPYPYHMISRALDALARDEDILIVTSCGNDWDTTEFSNGFYHGLAVGAVHAREPIDPMQGEPANFAFVPIVQSSPGPLFGDIERLYPDVCATGAGPGTPELVSGQWQRRFYYPRNFEDPQARDACLEMPGVDVLDISANASYPTDGYNVSPTRYNLGTSEAAAQVSGAAALYRGYRASQTTPASAEETRAAILLNVLGTYTQADGTAAEPAAQHTYTNRNRMGVGYVRDDLLAQFAVRDPQIYPLAQTAGLSVLNPQVDIAYDTLPGGKRYGVVACWRRALVDPGGDAVGEGDLPNIDLEVWYQGTLLARSASSANSYERLVFMAPWPSGGALAGVTLRLRLLSVPIGNQIIPVQVVARGFDTELDPQTTVPDPVHAATGQVTSAPAGAGCTMTSKAWQIDRIVPTGYQDAYGSAARAFTDGGNPGGQAYYYTHNGYDHGFDLEKVNGNAVPGMIHRVTIDVGEMGGPIDIGGLAFRTWAPFAPTNDMNVVVQMWEGPTVGGPTVWFAPPGGAITVASTVLRAPGPIGAEPRLDRFVVSVPFTTNFNYAGVSQLHIWIGTSTGSPFVVDGINDGSPSPYRSQYFYPNALGGSPLVATMEGFVPVIGLIAASVPAPRTPLLEVFGEPWSGTSVSTQFDWRLSQLPAAPQVWVLAFGTWQDPPALVPSCSIWLSNAQVLASGASAGGFAFGTISLPAGSVHEQFGLQMLLYPDRYSNALRISVGGGL
ncbi:MAG TPA: S8 family serine peptidase [Planctomycetota bacterium]|nr:S8 family serine peptidase [Planctomycetota bacterium]